MSGTPPVRTRSVSRSSRRSDEDARMIDVNELPGSGSNRSRRQTRMRKEMNIDTRRGGEGGNMMDITLTNNSNSSNQFALPSHERSISDLIGTRRSARGAQTPMSNQSLTPRELSPRSNARLHAPMDTGTGASSSVVNRPTVVRKRRRSTDPHNEDLPNNAKKGRGRSRGRRSMTNADATAGQPQPPTMPSVHAQLPSSTSSAHFLQPLHMPPANPHFYQTASQAKGRQTRKYRRRGGGQQQPPQPQPNFYQPTVPPMASNGFVHLAPFFGGGAGQPPLSYPAANSNSNQHVTFSAPSHRGRGRGGKQHGRGGGARANGRSGRGGITPARLPDSRPEAPHNTSNFLMNNVAAASPDTSTLLVPVAAQYGSMAHMNSPAIHPTISDRREDGFPMMVDEEMESCDSSGHDLSSIGEEDAHDSWKEDMHAAAQKLNAGTTSWQADLTTMHPTQSRRTKRRSRGGKKQREQKRRAAANNRNQLNTHTVAAAPSVANSSSSTGPLYPHPTRRSALVRGAQQSNWFNPPHSNSTPLSITPTASYPSTRSTSRSPAGPQPP